VGGGIGEDLPGQLGDGLLFFVEHEVHGVSSPWV
jgi:hypothetical protein